MADALLATVRRYELRSGHYAGDVEEEEREESGSATSEESYISEGEGAPDLVVEASPFQGDGSDGRMTKEDVDASFFSDYEAEARSKAIAIAPLTPPPPPPPPPLKKSSLAKRTNGGTDPLPHGEKREVEEEELHDGDAFYDAEYASSLGEQKKRRGSSPSPTPEAAVQWKQGKVLTTSSAHHNGRANSWLDPLRSLSSPPLDVDVDHDQFGRLLLRAPHGLSDSPRRGSDSSPSAPRSNTPRSYVGAPPAAVREGTAAPSPPFHPISSVDLPDQPSFVWGSHDSPRNAPVDVVKALSSTATAQHGGGAPASKGSRAPLPSPPPPPLQGHQANRRAASTADTQTAVVASTPPHKPPTAAVSWTDVPTSAETVVRALVPGLHPLPTAVVTDGSTGQKRVVRERAPRGVPLLLQCTEHADTPTRTIVIPSAAEEKASVGGDEDEETVSAGPHTSAYRETSGMSDLISSASRESPVRSAKKSVRKDLMRHTPERAVDCRRRSGRSKSPRVSFVDHLPSGADAASTPPQHDLPPSLHRLSPSSASSTDTEADAFAPPELVDFSVLTEAMGHSTQEDSVVLCGFSVESLPMSAGVVRADEESHPSRPCARAAQQPRLAHPPTASRRTLRTTDAPHADASSIVQPPREAYASYAAPHSRNQPEAGQANPYALQRPTPALVHGSARHDDRRLPWPSRELEYPPPAAEPIAAPATVRTTKEPLKVVDIYHTVDSVEEAVVGESADYEYTTSYAGPYNAMHSNPTDDTLGAMQTAATPTSENRYDPLQHRRQQREAVRQLLARQTDPQRHSTSRAQSDDDTEIEGDTAPQQLSSAAYVLQQERLREQRMAAETERLRLGLALDVCQAVRPYGRDLLLMFLLLVEESNASLRRHRQSSKTLKGSSDAFADTAPWTESRVRYEMCAEAVNCVLARHGVRSVRATRELCRRVVTWCGRNLQGSSRSFEASSASMDETLVEYTAFVSCVMEFAAQYRSNAS
ncbi:hypothetical protein ABB37_01891 [Leptomonas pyrrhocoris]|uniref:Uncharacterized protein n=1 Tax=Leptomonas pyrrhocoris TaxID=157538 RepID=A0A0N1J561_LEPPY|nr:hypothetical protein ABB37_01891 [Leptomonas pyrrhocoris]KPA83618.1 hypothetical protein ABB37_01891 [Leptomonas pyrrhocoris]|eukprot:XP_015662057.1 hypothetical protein ABB37_01891 [Leptomonas pyrrhocoris]